MVEAADRGKSLEERFKAMCKHYEKSANFASHRFPDARAGSFVTAPSDFQTCYNSKLRLIECKEVSFDNRLPYGNFKSDQVARMRLWQLAGAGAWVLIYHTGIKLYRVLPIDRFLVRDPSKGSWFFEPCEDIVTTDLVTAFEYIHSKN